MGWPRLSDADRDFILSSPLNGVAVSKKLGIAPITVWKYRKAGGYNIEHRGVKAGRVDKNQDHEPTPMDRFLTGNL